MALILILTLSGAVSAEKRTALVIGNGGYKSAPLANAVNDATDMKNLLEKMQFEVIFRADADKGTMLKAMEQFNKKLKHSDVGLFYFAGHGMQINGENYLVPVRTHITSEIDVEYAALAAGRVLGKMKDTSTRVNIIILDACRNNPFKRSFRTSSKGLAQMNAPTGSILAYATAPGDVAADGKGRNGLYTSQLMKHIRTPGITIEKMFKRTRNDVMQSAEKMGFKQVPWESSSMTGEFYFAAGTTIVEGSQASVASRPSFGSLQVRSRPSGARISLNNVDKGIAPVDITDLSPGSYQIAGRLSGYQSLEKQVRVNSGRRAMLTLYLDPLKTAARLYVNPTPDNAQVRIMNIPEKYYSGIGLKPGRYQVEVSHTGYETHSRWIEITDTDDIDLYVELFPEAAPQQVVTVPSTTLTVSSSASGTRRPGEEWQDPVTDMEFVWVPGGEFMMGSNNGGSYERPIHKVRLDGFWMGKYEVTQGQWQKIMGNNPSSFKKGNDFPVEKVSWNDANIFIKKLNSQAGHTFSLPSEAQWEYAARSGGKNQKYSGGDDVNRFAWYKSNSGRSTHKVGTKTSNDLGIYDMSGNVWEWCQEIYAKDAYKKHSSKNPLYAQGGSYRVYRGGSWSDNPAYVRCASRSRSTPGNRNSDLGFRLLRTN